MSTTQSESVLNAIELMTAWSARPEGPPDLLVHCLHRQLDQRPASLAAAVELIMGMTTLCGLLLVQRHEETGATTQETLRELALHFAQS